MHPSPGFHFISGLPRAGSTLLAAILRQNPRFHAGMTSPVGSLVLGMLNQFSAGGEIAPLVSLEQRRRLLRGVFDAYYADQAEKAVVFDTNRLWCARLPALLDLFPDAKVIACVRNVAWIMDSIERLYRANPYENTRLYGNDAERNTVFSRVETLAQGDRLVGFAWSALKEAFYGEQAGSLLLVDYDLLANVPGKVLPLIYGFLGEETFAHDFERVAYDCPEFDANLGLSGLHRIRPRVAPAPRQSILPPDLFRKYEELSFWNDRRGSRAHVITAASDKTAAPVHPAE
ncbi:MAG: sulfotransferase [Gallionellaceae bacterium]|nr:sulfotransferase [Gallionellaceae bacterium]